MATAELTEPVSELPEANVRPAGQWPEEEFVSIPDVAIFAEHETTTKSGRPLRFGPAELKAVADCCNRKIRATGDYAAIAIGHTSDTPGPRDPEVIGFAGPFRLGVLPDGRHAILADFHVFREDFPRLKKYPRRSPELWVEDAYEDMSLDPICLLGAEAPRLDLGMLYSALRHDGREIERYSACFAGPLSVSPRGDGQAGKRKYGTTSTDQPPQLDEEKPVMALDEQDIRQLVAALDQLDWVQWVRQKMQAETAPGGEGLEPASPSPSDMPPGGAPAGEPAPEPGASAPPPPREGEPERSAARPRQGIDGMRYARMEAQLARAERQAAEALEMARTEQGKRIDVERYQRLTLLRESHAFDLDEEFETVKYGKASDEEFERHCQRIQKNYTKIPIGQSLPIPEGTPPADTQPGGSGVRERYAKEAVDKAVAWCKSERLAGRNPDYAQALQKAQAGEL